MSRLGTLSLVGFIATSIIWFSCAPSENQEQKTLKSGIIVENMDTTVNPGDDFFRYVNGGWLNRTEIPEDRSYYGNAVMLSETAEKQVKAIIDESASGEFEKGSNQQMIGDLYKSYMDTITRNEKGVAPLQAIFDEIDQIASYSDLAAQFAKATKYGYNSPLALAVFADVKAPEVYALYLVQNGLGLPDRDYYLRDDEKSVQLKADYQAQISTMFELASLPNGDQAAAAIVDLETKMAELQMAKELTRNFNNLYNKFTVDSLKGFAPDFDWSAYLKEAEVPESNENIVVAMVDYTKGMNDVIKNTDLETWKSYLKWSVLNDNDTYLSIELDDQNFDFNKKLYGQNSLRPRWTRAVSYVNNTIGEAVGQVYVDRHFPPEAKERMEILVGNLVKAYEASIKDLDWMSDSTKTQALDKLSKFNTKIGYPDIWRDYSNLEISANDLVGNKLNTSVAEYRRIMDRLGGPIVKHEWGLSPQVVNAYYDPTLNEIVFPAAILQPPYFQLDAEEAVNYGAIGYVIGHEIGHGFDDSGSRFDGDGALRNWWTDTDSAAFSQRTSKLVSQYDGFKVFDDLNVNGEFTLGENIGDLGGLHIAMKAYQMSLNGAEAPVVDGYTARERMFIGYAQTNMAKLKDEFLRLIVNTDPHSPHEFRVNGVVRNIPEFYETFNVKVSDSLYLAPEERVKIW
ncbi:MAG: M13 family metallopeptidase [Cyclobacteriaceae bacterium]